MRRYTVVLTPEPDGSAYNMVVPALPGCLTWGATIEDARAMAQDAIATSSTARQRRRGPTLAGRSSPT